MVGTQIGCYRIDEKIGEGGMGTVYRAMEVNLERPVAIKVLNANVSRNPALAERFRAEARAQANLNHTNIATLYTLLIHEESAMMVMEFVQGENFQQMVARRGPIPAEDAIPMFKQALLGIGCAHRVGIIHRDIKPANLMLNKAGVVKVMDFGIAKAVGERGMTRTGLQVGTVHYMSPEQVKSNPVDVRSDVYALGITLYEMLSGRVPFDANSEFEVLTDHVKTAPPLPSLFCKRISKGLENIVLKALEKDPEDRFQSTEEFSAALDKPELWVAYMPKSQQLGFGREQTRPLSYDPALFDSVTRPPMDTPVAPLALPALVGRKLVLFAVGGGICLLAIAGFAGYRIFGPKHPVPSAPPSATASNVSTVPPANATQTSPQTVTPVIPAELAVGAKAAPSSNSSSTGTLSAPPLSPVPQSIKPGTGVKPKDIQKTQAAEYSPAPTAAPVVVVPEPQQAVAQSITVPASQEIQIRLISAIDSASVEAGQQFEVAVNNPVSVNEHVAIPKGSAARVHVVKVSKADRAKGDAHLTFTLKSITIAGHSYNVETDVYDAAIGSRAKRLGKLAAFGGAMGAVFGGGTHGAKSTQGSQDGSGPATGADAAAGAPSLKLPAESLLLFHLVTPVIIGK